MKPSCANCRFSRVTPTKPRYPEGYDTIDRECRFLPPEREVGTSEDPRGYFPRVAEHQWCGKHEEPKQADLGVILALAAIMGAVLVYNAANLVMQLL